MDLNDIHQRHERPQFDLGTEVMWCDPHLARPVWESGTVIASGYNQERYNRKERRVDYAVWRKNAGDGKQAAVVTLVPDDTVIVTAGRDRNRPCWTGTVVATKVWQLQLLSYDWEVHGEDTDVVADMRGSTVGDSTTNRQGEAWLLLNLGNNVEVRVNVFTFWDWAAGARDMASMP